MAKIEINRITNANIDVNGNSLLGRAEEIKLPDISAIMQEHKALGMVGKIELPAGFDKLEGEIKWNSLYKDVAKTVATRSRRCSCSAAPASRPTAPRAASRK